MYAVEPNQDVSPSSARWRFFALCLFLGSQGFTLPVLAIGPSWAVWPTLPDFASIVLGLVCVLPDRSMPPAQRALGGWFALLFAACLLSFLYMIVLAPPAGVEQADRAVGLFELCRLTQSLVIFRAAARIPLTPQRTHILYALVTAVLWLVCFGILATFFHLVEPHALIQHLPQDRDVLGAWYGYADDELAHGWGAVGYNHAYGAAQVLILLALQMRLQPEPRPALMTISVVLALAASFLSGSRAGFAAVAAFIVLTLMQRPAFGLLVLLVVLAIGSRITPEELPDDVRQVVESQRALSDPAEEDSLNGRTQIWDRHLTFLRANPWLLPTGAGFGYTAATGDAHCLYLQILVEMGVLGLLLWGIVAFQVLAALYRLEPGPRPLFWATVAFLFSAVTQETFYPVAALGNFLGLYLCGLAVSLSDTRVARTADAMTCAEGSYETETLAS